MAYFSSPQDEKINLWFVINYCIVACDSRWLSLRRIHIIHQFTCLKLNLFHSLNMRDITSRDMSSFPLINPSSTCFSLLSTVLNISRSTTSRFYCNCNCTYCLGDDECQLLWLYKSCTTLWDSLNILTIKFLWQVTFLLAQRITQLISLKETVFSTWSSYLYPFTFSWWSCTRFW